MAHITLSIPDELYREMKRHPEIRWSEAARKGIREQIMHIKGIMRGSEWLKMMPESTRRGIEELKKFTKEDWERWNKKMKEKDLKRAKFLMQVSS